MTPLSFVSAPFLRTHRGISIQKRALCPRRAPKMVSDLSMARIGHGFDLHRLEAGLPLILGGIELKHERGCAGHSDGDAVYHCVVDAVLGALALPDIGQLFPDTDPRFKDCESHVFMTAAYEKMKQEGFKIGNIDVTIILERPKLSPHKALIRANIARLLDTNQENVNVKAKTHEKVDAVGENRAVSVHAVALLQVDTEAETSSRVAATSEEAQGDSLVRGLMNVVEERVSKIQGLTPEQSRDCAIQKLYDTVVDKKGADPASSWTAKLFLKGREKIAQKVGEEAVEVVIDAARGNREEVVKESADLLYHLCVLWAEMGVTPDAVWSELASREGKSGIAEKASRLS